MHNTHTPLYGLHKRYGLIIFMANPFSTCLGVFFKRKTATPFNQEARILTLQLGLSLPRNYILSMRTPSVSYTMSPQGDWHKRDMLRGLHGTCCEGSMGHVARAPWDMLPGHVARGFMNHIARAP